MNGGSRNFEGPGRKSTNLGKMSSILPIPPPAKTERTSSDPSKEEVTSRRFGTFGKRKLDDEEKDAPKCTEPSTSKDEISVLEKCSSEVCDGQENASSEEISRMKVTKFDRQEKMERAKAVAKKVAEEHPTAIMEEGIGDASTQRKNEMLRELPSLSQATSSSEQNANGSSENQKNTEDVYNSDLSDDDSGNSAEKHLPDR